MAVTVVAGGLLAVALAAVSIALDVYLSPPLGPRSHSKALLNQEASSSLDVFDVLGSSPTKGFRQAVESRRFSFPQDHGPHLGFRTEWWYVSGNMSSRAGREFGFQLTFFRLEASPSLAPVDRPQFFLAHFSVTDVEQRKFYSFERTGRSELGTAGARGNPPEIFVDHWKLEANGEHWHLAAQEQSVGLVLEMRANSPVVPQGDQGLSQKGAEPGAASYYYSIPRWTVEGALTLGKEKLNVRGSSWLDREWGTNALGSELEGWDWFGLHLDDGTNLMYYRLRRRGGAESPRGSGSVSDALRLRRKLGPSNVTLTILSEWISGNEVRYPARWRLAIRDGPTLEIVPLVADQLWRGTFEYWEGAVRVSGQTLDGTPLSGRGYVELTGYRSSERDRRQRTK